MTPPLDHRRFAAARMMAATRFPYLASVLFASPVVPAPGIGTVAIDRGWRIFADPEVVARWSTDELAGTLVHHVGHLLRDHAGRAHEQGVGEEDSEDWLSAADAEINDDLVGQVTLPDDPVTPSRLGCAEGRLAEEYFDAVRARRHQDAPSEDEPAEAVAGGTAGGEPGDDEVARGGAADGDVADGQAGGGGVAAAEASTGDAVTDEAPDRATGTDCGSGADGLRRPWEWTGGLRLESSSDGSSPDGSSADGSSSEPGPPTAATGLSSHDQELLRRRTAAEVLEHGRQAGTLPGGWRRWAEEVLSTKVDWRRVLAAHVRAGIADVTGAVDYSYRRPSRRASVSADVVLPSLRRPVPEVAVVCDTSGSMSQPLLAQVLAEVEGLLRAVGLRRQGVRVLACDTDVQTARRVSSSRQVELVGGGGTDMGAGIRAALATRPRPAVIVVLTDGYTPWPHQRPGPGTTRVVVALLGGRAPSPPDWARVVQVEDVVST